MCCALNSAFGLVWGGSTVVLGFVWLGGLRL